MNVKDNDHVTVHDLRGFVSDNIQGAFNETYAISRGTKCKQYLFSLSLNPPDTENVPVEAFEQAIADIEDSLGLSEQPRAIVFHEKEGRRHAHCVWSRIDTDQMKAINLSHYKYKLRDKSRELYLVHQWQMPKGLISSEARDPLNFTLAEWQQAKRTGVDAKKLKAAIQDAWAISDSASAFKAALKERGFRLAQGDRRGHVAVDINGNVYAISRAVGIKAKQVRIRLGSSDDMPKVSKVQDEIASDVSTQLQGFADAQSYKLKEVDGNYKLKRHQLVETQRKARLGLLKQQEQHRIAETRKRADRLPRGLKAIWFRITGAYQKIKRENEAALARLGDIQGLELETVVHQQLTDRRDLRAKFTDQRQTIHQQLQEIVGSGGGASNTKPISCKKKRTKILQLGQGFDVFVIIFTNLLTKFTKLSKLWP